MTRRYQRPAFDADGEPLLTAADAARRLGVSVDTVRRWVRKGSVKCVEIGPFRRKRLRQADVDQQRRYCGSA